MRTATLHDQQEVQEQQVTEAPSATIKAPASRSHRAAPVLAMIGGLAVLALAATLVVAQQGDIRPAGPATTAPSTAPGAIPVAARDISVVSQVYGPGENSGWHAHSGIHAVAVLSGVLTVYDAQCHAQTFEAGRPYVGGQDLHLVRNETSEPVVMSVTYLNPATGGGPTRHVPPPPGCEA